MSKEKHKNEHYRPNIFLMIIGGLGKGLLVVAAAIGKGIWNFFSLIASGIWWLVKSAGKSIGWLVKQPLRFLGYLINGRIPEFETIRQEEIFWRIKRHYRRKRLFLLNGFAYGSGIIFSILMIIVRYQDWQNATLPSWKTYTTTALNNTILSAGLFMGIWTLVLVFHFVFNRMGDAEDTALGEALEKEYARGESEDNAHWDRQQLPEISRLVDVPGEADTYEDEEKPKRNGARM